jgi:hypothetical protein
MSVEIRPSGSILYQHSTDFTLKENGTIEVSSVTKINGKVINDIKIAETKEI